MHPIVRIALVLLVLPLSGPTHAQAPSDWVGIWAPDGLDITMRIDLALEDGALIADVNSEGNNLGDRAETVRTEGRRLVMTLEGGDTLTMQLARDGQRATIRGRYGRRRVSLTLKRRGSVWNMARVDVLDAMHDGQSPSAASLADAVAIEAGLRRGGRADTLTDVRQGACAYERLILEWAGPRMSMPQRGAYLARVAGARSLCEVHQSELADPARCDRLTILDSDGATTVRERASSRSESVGTLPNGTTVSVVGRRGSWAEVEGTSNGWIHTSNAHCASTR